MKEVRAYTADTPHPTPLFHVSVHSTEFTDHIFCKCTFYKGYKLLVFNKAMCRVEVLITKDLAERQSQPKSFVCNGSTIFLEVLIMNGLPRLAGRIRHGFT